MCYKILFFWLSFCVSTYGFCHNGKIAYAYQLNKVAIDGSLADWPANFEKYSIGNSPGTFMVGYNLKEQSLYIGLEVTDDINVPGSSIGSIWGRMRDQHFLYLDPEHSKDKGSGVLMLFGSQTGVDIWKPENNWDPYNQSFSDKNVTLKTKRTGNKTIYEWKIFLGNAIAVNKSIGLDHELQDADSSNKNVIHAWGPGGLKNRVPFNLGDVMLLEEKAKLDIIKGHIKWSKPFKDPLPPAVKIASVKDPLLWCQVPVDSVGKYALLLPNGSYTISPAYKTTNAAKNDYKTRINDVPQPLSDTLKIDWYTRPDYLIPQKGLLFDYDDSKTFLVDQFIEAYRNFHNIPGMSIALIRDGRVVYNKVFGVRSTITNEPATLQTLFETASISKSVFAFAVNRLVAKGLLDLDKPLQNYLPFDNLSEDERATLITARMVLSHQTGLPNWAFGGPFGWKGGKKTKLLFTPGSKFEYSGEGYQYLGRVLEKITGKALEEIMNEEVYSVMGMTATSLTATDANKNKIGIGHVSDMPLLWSLEASPWVAGSMYSTTADLAKYISGLINGVGLSKENYKQLFTPQVENKTAFMQFYGGDKVFHSLGFEFQQSRFGNIIHHGGNNGDYQGRLALIPEQRIGYVVLCNSNAGFFMDLDLQRFLITGRN